MPLKSYTVRAEWDAEAGVWVVITEDVPGLVTEAGTLEWLLEKLRNMVRELLELNGVLPRETATMAPFRFIAERRNGIAAPSGLS